MQSLWSKVLAGEANHPGSFSRKTVNLVADLERRDAEAFINLCRFVWTIDRHARPLLFDFGNEIYNLHSISFDNVNHLQSLGLVTISNFGYALHRLPKLVTASYCGRSITLALANDSDNKLKEGKVLFTQSGYELARICEIVPVDGFFDYVYDIWASEGRFCRRENQMRIVGSSGFSISRVRTREACTVIQAESSFFMEH